MSKDTISVSDIDTKIFEIIKQNMDKMRDAVDEEIFKATKNTIEDLKVTAPKSDRNHLHLADTFVYQKKQDILGTYYKIYSEEKGYLVHLLEFGFKPYRTNKYIKGTPFMRNAKDKNIEILVNNLKKRIKEIL